MAEPTSNVTEAPVRRELVITRICDAPREIVFKAWTDPVSLKRWWGPKDFTNPVCDIDLRPGGAMHIHMRAPDGTVYPMRGVYREIIASERLVFSSSALDEVGNPLFEVLTTVRLAEYGAKTELTLQARVVMETAGAARHLAGMEQGWSQTLDRLAAEVSLMTGKANEIVTSRVLNAPRERVFEAWTNPDQLAHWWGPKDFTNTFHEFNPKPGGIWRYVMHGPNGVDYQNQCVFVEVVRPERIVLDHVTDPQFRLVATFVEQAGDTRLTFRMVFQSAAECERVKSYAVEANEQNLDRLAAQLAKMA